MSQPDRVQRFSSGERLVHWTVAALVLTLIGTGIAIYFPSFTRIVGRRGTVRELHVWSGYLLPLPLIVGLLLRPTGLRQDFRRLSRWLPDDRVWLFSKRLRPRLKIGKFNSGQKLLASLLAISLTLAFVTGLMLRFPDSLPDDLRTGATFVHDWIFFAIMALIIGHVLKAIQDRDALSAMTRGHVDADNAARRWPLWNPEATSTTAAAPDVEEQHKEPELAQKR
ncbi:MAG: cytochrome b/b6 domain-containing protein [Acidimicrobiales bacterium]